MNTLNLNEKVIPAINKDSAFFMLTQVLWWGMGISLFYDAAETIFGLPHLLVVILYSSLMITSTWFGGRVMILMSIFTIPALIAMIYFSLSSISSESALIPWANMLNVKFVEYSSWLLLVMGSFVSATTIMKPSHFLKKLEIRPIIAVVGFVGGSLLMVYSGINSAISNSQADIMLIFAQQGANIVWVLGLSARTSASQHGKKKSWIAKCNISLGPVLFLLVGTLSAVFYDWFSQYMVGWLQYPTMFLPPLAMLLFWK